VEIHEQDKIREEGFNSSAPSSIHDSDESSEDSASDEEESDHVPAREEEVAEDLEGVMPEAIEEGHSPVDDLKGFNWGEIDEELESFMGSDDSESDNDSGAESVASDISIRSRTSNKIVPKKRKVGDTTDDENSGDESTLAKKQRIANSRSTGLKTVKTPNSMQSESSLPTPGPTGDEDGEEDAVDQIPTGDDDDGDDPFGDDLEADLMAEFEREEEEFKDGGGG
jgi:RNA polymerase II subunit A-like phosphatase